MRRSSLLLGLLPLFGPALLLAPTARADASPAAPRDVTATTAGSTVTVRWVAAPATGTTVTGYGVLCTSTDSASRLEGQAGASARQLALSGVQPDATYRCVVSATGAGGSSPAAYGPYVMHAVIDAAGGTVSLHVPVQGGQRLSAGATAVPGSEPQQPTLTVRRPDGVQVSSSASRADGAWFADAAPMYQDGTALVDVQARPGVTGAAEVVANVFRDVTADLTVGEELTTVHLLRPGQNAQLSFSGVAGQVVAVDGHTTMSYVPFQVVLPDGTSWASGGLVPATGGDVVRLVLPATGRYRLRLDPLAAETGTATLRVLPVAPDGTGTLTAGAPAQAVHFSVAQHVRRTFDVAAGQSLTLTGAPAAGLSDVRWSVYAPDGHTVDGGLWGESWGTWAALTQLPQAGTYLLELEPAHTAPGDLTLQLGVVPPDSTGRLTVDGPLRTVSFAPGQGARRTFVGTAGQRLGLIATTSASLERITVQVQGPDGEWGTAIDLWGGYGTTLEPLPALPADGTYAMRFSRAGAAGGTVDLRLVTIPHDSTGSLTPGTPSTVRFSPGQNASRTLTARVGTRIVLTGTTSAGLTDVQYQVIAPDGAVAARSTFRGGGVKTVEAVSGLRLDGDYLIVLDPVAAGSGTLTLKAVLSPAP